MLARPCGHSTPAPLNARHRTATLPIGTSPPRFCWSSVLNRTPPSALHTGLSAENVERARKILNRVKPIPIIQRSVATSRGAIGSSQPIP